MSFEPKTRVEAAHHVRHGGSIKRTFEGAVTCLNNLPHKFVAMISNHPHNGGERKFFVLFYSDLYGGITVDITAKQVASFIRRNFPRSV